jgi:hypothetical protein
MSANGDRSFVYQSVLGYRLAMIALYRTDYWRRTRQVAALLGGCKSVVELCFGDARLAESCSRAGSAWTGVDFNPVFCREARGRGFSVIEADFWEAELPPADAYVMMAALYHFHDRLPEFFDRVFAGTRHFVLSEPIRNLSSGNGTLARAAQRFSNPGDGAARFRYDEESLRLALAREALRLDVGVHEISQRRDMLVELHA